jgi:hypothetical protein
MVPHKFGIMRDSKGKEYRCEWKQGEVDGIAKIIYPDGKEFLGNYIAGAKNGLGKVCYGNKVYLGEFKDNLRTGIGQLVELENCDLLTSERRFLQDDFEPGVTKFNYTKKGTFVKSSLHGFAIFEIPAKKYMYVGYFNNGIAEGDGYESNKDGKYHGQFKNGLRDGVGELIGENSYRGYWVKGNKDMYGIETSINGDVFEGNYEHGKKHGYGKYLSKDGSKRYLGSYENSLKSGFGRLELGNNLYVGNFSNNKRDGVGF